MCKKSICVALLLLHCCVGYTYASEPIYQITETELTVLENNNNKQLQLLREQENQLILVSQQLTTSQQQLATLKTQLGTAKKQIQQSETALQTAQESLQEYEKEVQSERNRLKQQRTIWAIVAGLCAYAAIK